MQRLAVTGWGSTGDSVIPKCSPIPVPDQPPGGASIVQWLCCEASANSRSLSSPSGKRELKPHLKALATATLYNSHPSCWKTAHLYITFCSTSYDFDVAHPIPPLARRLCILSATSNIRLDLAAGPGARSSMRPRPLIHLTSRPVGHAFVRST